MVDYQVHPRKSTPLDSTSVTTEWDADTASYVALPSGVIYLVVYSTTDVHLVADSSASPPDDDGAVYTKDQTHIIECPDKSTLHHKGLSAGGTLYVTAFHN